MDELEDFFESEHSTSELDKIISGTELLRVDEISDKFTALATDMKELIEHYEKLYGTYEDTYDSFNDLKKTIDESSL